MASLDQHLSVKLDLDVELTETAETLLRRLIQQEMQVVLKMAESSALIQEAVRTIAREELEAALERQARLHAAKMERHQ